MTLRRATTREAVKFWSFVDRVTDRVLASDEFRGGSVTFKVGDRVEWTSQSAGITKRKEGRVVNVIPPGGFPYGEHGDGQVRNPGASRDHESYVVRVRGRGLYWPRVSALRPAPPAPGGGEETT